MSKRGQRQRVFRCLVLPLALSCTLLLTSCSVFTTAETDAAQAANTPCDPSSIETSLTIKDSAGTSLELPRPVNIPRRDTEKKGKLKASPSANKHVEKKFYAGAFLDDSGTVIGSMALHPNKPRQIITYHEDAFRVFTYTYSSDLASEYQPDGPMAVTPDNIVWLEYPIASEAQHNGQWILVSLDRATSVATVIASSSEFTDQALLPKEDNFTYGVPQTDGTSVYLAGGMNANWVVQAPLQIQPEGQTSAQLLSDATGLLAANPTLGTAIQALVQDKELVLTDAASDKLFFTISAVEDAEATQLETDGNHLAVQLSGPCFSNSATVIFDVKDGKLLHVIPSSKQTGITLTGGYIYTYSTTPYSREDLTGLLIEADKIVPKFYFERKVTPQLLIPLGGWIVRQEPYTLVVSDFSGYDANLAERIQWFICED